MLNTLLVWYVSLVVLNHHSNNCYSTKDTTKKCCIWQLSYMLYMEVDCKYYILQHHL